MKKKLKYLYLFFEVCTLILICIYNKNLEFHFNDSDVGYNNTGGFDYTYTTTTVTSHDIPSHSSGNDNTNIVLASEETCPGYNNCYCQNGVYVPNGCQGQENGGGTTTTTTSTTVTVHIPAAQCWRFSCHDSNGNPVSHVYTNTNKKPTYNTALKDALLNYGSLPNEIKNEISKLPKEIIESYNGQTKTIKKIDDGVVDICMKSPCAEGCPAYIAGYCQKYGLTEADDIGFDTSLITSTSNAGVTFREVDVTSFATEASKEFTNRCYWEKFEGNCNPANNCYLVKNSDNKYNEVRGDFAGYKDTYKEGNRTSDGKVVECKKKCYGNASTLKDSTVLYYGYDVDLYTDVFWDNLKTSYSVVSPSDKAELRNKTKNMKYLEGISEKDCELTVTPPPTTTGCKPDLTAVAKQEKQSTTCEETTTISSEDGSVRCGDLPESGFYTIDCKSNFSNAFDFGNDGMNGTNLISLYSGQGFGSKIETTYVKECIGTFNAEVWNKAYDIVVSNRDKESKGSKEWNKQNNIVNELKGYITSFNESFNEGKNDLNTIPTVEVTINTNPKISVKNFTYKVIEEGNDSGNKTIISTETLRDGSKVYNFKYSNAKNPRKIEYYPPETKFDSISGKIATSSTIKNVSGGNKIYTDLDAVPGIYDIELKVNDANNQKIIYNNKCSLNIIKKDLLYRIIDVINPFVNASYKKGDNWVNDNYDYTNVISKDTWSGNGLYIFDLTKDIISALKEDNIGDVNKYLGTCSLPDNQKKEVIKKICNIINSANSTKK